MAAQLFNAEKKVLPPPTKRPVHRGFSRKVVAVVARLLNSKKGKRKTCCVKLGSYLFTKVRQTKKFDRKAEPGLGIIDSLSVRWEDNRSLNGIDGNKKIKGAKHHVVVDKNGFLLAVMVTIACVHDSKAAYLLARYLRELCCHIKIILVDAGYRGEIADKIKTAFGYILEVVVSGDKVNGFKPIGKRWIVERTFHGLTTIEDSAETMNGHSIRQRKWSN